MYLKGSGAVKSPKIPTTTRRQLYWLAGVLAFFAAQNADAAPRVIKDNRLSNLVGTPSLGRGYAQHSNSLKSVCFEKVKANHPSFDFEYEIEEVTEDFLQEILAKDASRVKGHSFLKFLDSHLNQSKNSGKRMRNLIAHITVDAYHNTLDETGSPLSGSVRRLLKDKRFATFFASCGFFYIRSVRTFSTYMAILRFEETSDKATDDRFVGLLEQGLLSFGSGREMEHVWLEKLTKESQSRGLQVLTQGIGLSKGKFVNLVPVSIQQFRQTIQSAASLMQDERAGVVTAIEIAPWVENPEVDMIIEQALEGSGDAFSRLHALELNAQAISYISEHRDYRIDQYYHARLCLEHLNTSYPALDPKVVGRMERVVDPKRTLFRNQMKPRDKTLFISLEVFREHFERFPPQRLLDQNSAYLQSTKANQFLPAKTLKRGDHNHAVARLQDALVRLGYISKEDKEQGPGFFGPRTERGLVAFQKSAKLAKAHWGTYNQTTRVAMEAIEIEGAYACIQTLYAEGLDRADFSQIPACKTALNVSRSVDRFLDEYCLPEPVEVHYREFDW